MALQRTSTAPGQGCGGLLGVNDAGSGWGQLVLVRTARERDLGGLESLKPQPWAWRVCLLSWFQLG